MNKRKNLNNSKIPTDSLDFYNLKDFSNSKNAIVECYFRNLETILIGKIYDCDLTMGCIAWLTNKKILEALSNKDSCIVVQKEDFLRPENRKSDWNIILQDAYSKIKCDVDKLAIGFEDDLLRSLNTSQTNTLYSDYSRKSSVFCVGNHNSDKNPIHPRMHNKFLIFFKKEKHSTMDHCYLPYAVWTGSFNFTKNATKSFENAVFIKDPKVVLAYWNEWQQIFALSENLDWKIPWIAPIHRIGT